VLKKVKNVLIRADSSSSIGLGHIMRDLVLAKQFPSKNVIFATQNLEGNINHKITEAGYKLETLQTNDLEELDSLIKKLNIDLLIIDNYNINYAYEKQLKTQNSKLKIMVLDDTYEKHHCDILLNQNLGANEEKYKTLVPKNCELRCGEKHTLIREEFHQAKSSTTYPLSPTPYHLFISFGGSDPTSTTIKVLESLKAFKNIKANVVTTTANKNLDQLKSFAKDNLWVDLHINSNNIANIMATSNLAIVTPSVILNEVYFMQLPFIAIKTMNNQKRDI
jgi:UDP-2,4-diacetamido-2,4,6-trideoxy-beta-L-altropyranose hydrolase